MQSHSLLARDRQCGLVLLGASNLTLGFPWVVKLAQGLWGNSIEISAALGYGRSYGRPSRVLGRVLPGILESGLWPQLEVLPRPLSAIVTDIGNDILYQVPVPQILEWVLECVRRLQHLDAEVTLTDLPWANLVGLGDQRFRFCRSLLVPSCTLSLGEVSRRVRLVSKGLARLAAETGAVLIIPQAEWYGFDPLHIRPKKWKSAWQNILTQGRAKNLSVQMPGVDLGDWIRFHFSRPERQWFFQWERRKPQPALRMGGSRVWLY
jgi:hypothetical protein